MSAKFLKPIFHGGQFQDTSMNTRPDICNYSGIVMSKLHMPVRCLDLCAS